MEELGKWEEVVNLIENLKLDASKVYVKKNKQAGIRFRKGLMSIRSLCKECKEETIGICK